MAVEELLGAVAFGAKELVDWDGYLLVPVVCVGDDLGPCFHVSC